MANISYALASIYAALHKVKVSIFTYLKCSYENTYHYLSILPNQLNRISHLYSLRYTHDTIFHHAASTRFNTLQTSYHYHTHTWINIYFTQQQQILSRHLFYKTNQSYSSLFFYPPYLLLSITYYCLSSLRTVKYVLNFSICYIYAYSVCV